MDSLNTAQISFKYPSKLTIGMVQIFTKLQLPWVSSSLTSSNASWLQSSHLRTFWWSRNERRVLVSFSDSRWGLKPFFPLSAGAPSGVSELSFSMFRPNASNFFLAGVHGCEQIRFWKYFCHESQARNIGYMLEVRGQPVPLLWDTENRGWWKGKLINCGVQNQENLSLNSRAASPQRCDCGHAAPWTAPSSPGQQVSLTAAFGNPTRCHM